MSNYTANDWIGKGIKFPKPFNKYSGRTEVTSSDARIQQSIYIILSTRVGERFFLPEFGSRLHELVFEPNDYILRDMLILYIKEALTKWEPRISIISVDPKITADHSVPVSITYKLTNSNIVTNYVYPFQRSIRDL